MIADAIHDYARSKGWAPSDYRIFIRVNVSWNIFSVGIVSDRFARDEYEQVSDDEFVAVMRHLHDKLREVPGLYESTGLNLARFDDEAALSTFYFPILGPDEFEMDFESLNPGADDPRKGFLRGAARGGH